MATHFLRGTTDDIPNGDELRVVIVRPAQATLGVMQGVPVHYYDFAVFSLQDACQDLLGVEDCG